MKYFLWIDGKQDGPFEPEEIREMLGEGHIVPVTLALQEDGAGEWTEIKNLSEIIDLPKQSSIPPKAPVEKPPFSLPQVKSSGVASALEFFAVLEFIGAIVGGFIVGSDNANLGFLVFVCSFLSGLILLGFAQVIENTKESAQRLMRMEMLLWKIHEDKLPPDFMSGEN